MLCRAQFMARFPPPLRWTLPALAPDQTETGAVRVNRAKAALERNRSTSAASPTMTAADKDSTAVQNTRTL